MNLRKILLLIFIILFNFNLINSKIITQFDINTIQTVYNGIESDETKIVAYGDYGSINISFDNGKSWEKQTIFNNGFIIDLKINNDTILAFNADGKIKASYDNGKTWLLIKDLTEEIYSVIKNNNEYLIRSDYKLTLIDVTGNVINQIVLDSKIYFDSIKSKFPQGNILLLLNIFKTSMNLFKDDYYVFLNEKSFDIYNSNLNYKENFKVITDTAITFFAIGNFINDGNHIYFRLNNKLIKTSNLVDFELIPDHQYITSFAKAKNIKNQILFIASDKKDIHLCQLNNSKNIEIITTSNYNNKLGSMIERNSFLDFTIVDNEVFYISGSANNGIGKFTIDKNGINKLETISDLYHSLFYNIIKSKNNTYILQNNEVTYSSNSFDEEQIKEENLLSYTKEYSNNFYKTNDKFQTFLPVMIDSGDNNSKVSNLYNYDIITDEMVLGYYESKQKKYGFYDNLNTNSDFSNFKFSAYKDKPININSNLFKNKEGEFFFITNYYLNPNSYSSEIEIVSKDYKNLQTKNFTKKNYFFIYNNNGNTDFENTLLDYDVNSHSKYIVTTNKSLDNIQQVIEFKNVYLNKFDSYNYTLNNREYLVFTNYYRDSTLDINLYDIESKTNKVIKFSKNPDLDILTTRVYYTLDNDTLFVAIKDSVFYIDFKNENDPLKLYCNLPNNGYFLYNMQKFGNDFIGVYQDDLRLKNFSKISYNKINDDTTSVENIEEATYLYTTPPYPNPTISEVTAKFYWDKSIDIDNSEIAVYDINGNKVSGKENLKLEKIDDWSGNIKWNCVGQPKGTYLIKIQHGNNTKTVKVVVN